MISKELSEYDSNNTHRYQVTDFMIENERVPVSARWMRKGLVFFSIYKEQAIWNYGLIKREWSDVQCATRGARSLNSVRSVEILLSSMDALASAFPLHKNNYMQTIQNRNNILNQKTCLKWKMNPSITKDHMHDEFREFIFLHFIICSGVYMFLYIFTSVII